MIVATAAELAIVRAILSEFVPGANVWAYGSRVTGRQRPHSDLDLALLAPEPLDLATLARLEDAFAESNLPYRVDVIDWERIGEAFRDLIRRSHEPLQAPSP